MQNWRTKIFFHVTNESYEKKSQTVLTQVKS